MITSAAESGFQNFLLKNLQLWTNLSVAYENGDEIRYPIFILNLQELQIIISGVRS